MPGTYQFTVTVSKKNMSSSAEVEVEVVPGNPPTISPIALESRYNPAHSIIINSVVSGAVGTCVHWQSALQDGYVYLDLDQVTAFLACCPPTIAGQVSKSAEVQCFVRDIPSREFPLVIPAPSNGFPGLQVSSCHPIPPAFLPGRGQVQVPGDCLPRHTGRHPGRRGGGDTRSSNYG